MCSASLWLTLGPFCPQGQLELIPPTGLKLTHTSLEGALPRLQVLRGLWHLDVGIEFFYLVEDRVFVIIFEVIITLLRGWSRREKGSTIGMYVPLALGPS